MIHERGNSKEEKVKKKGNISQFEEKKKRFSTI
jgi:hypothetical protein